MEHWKNLSLKDIEGEIWKDAVGFEGSYAISNMGRLKSCARRYTTKRENHKMGVTVKEIIMKQFFNHKGYLRVTLQVRGQYYSRTLHRLVALAFHLNPLRKREVNHKDTIKTNNCDWNLEWNTPKENMQHSYDNGTHRKRYGKDSNTGKAVVVLTSEMFIIEKFDTAKQASDFSKISRSVICGYAKRKGQPKNSFKRGVRKGRKRKFSFMYLSDYEKLQPAIAQQNALNPMNQQAQQ